MTSIAISDTAEADQTGHEEPRRELIEMLLSRQSCGLLREPAPDAAELALILDAGLCAPDHGRLRPWRFVVIRGEARAVFAELLVAALKRREADPQEAMVERLRNRILGVPLLIVVGAKIKSDGPIPEIEQLLSAGAAAMNMLNAIHALGYGGMWVTGANAYDRSVNEALGFAWPDRLVGMLFVGTRHAASVVASRGKAGAGRSCPRMDRHRDSVWFGRGRILIMPSESPSVPVQDVVVAAARCWRIARDRGEAVMPCLYAALEHRYGCSLLVPTFDGLICACEACLGRRLAIGEGSAWSNDERCLLELLDDPSRDDPCFRGPDVEAGALETRICAACSARIMLRLVLGRLDPIVANDSQLV